MTPIAETSAIAMVTTALSSLMTTITVVTMDAMVDFMVAIIIETPDTAPAELRAYIQMVQIA